MPSADYVIVGAGSAGCVLAGRLSEDPSCRVLLIEAGGSRKNLDVAIPAAFANQFQSKRDWNLQTEPEPHCHGRRLYMPRGKGLGGSSAMNAMLYVRGRPLDFDLWESQGAAGWGWDAVRPYFLRSEDNSRGVSEHHAVGGPLKVSDQRSPRALTASFLASAHAAGIPRVDDYNGPEQDGCAIAQVTQRNGRRFSSADAYVRPAMRRENLTVVTGAHVQRILLDGDRATGVAYVDRRGRPAVAHAGAEVILSAGAIGSPHLLMLSGIGAPDELQAAGVTPRVELPGVGENLQDHPVIGGIWQISGGGTLAEAERPRYLLEWLARGSGPLSSPVAEAFAFIRTRPGLPAPDIQIHAAPAFFANHGFDEYDGDAITIGPVLITPKSRGRLWLASDDAATAPRILTNSLAEPDDVRSLLDGLERARDIVRERPLADVIGAPLRPGPEMGPDDYEDDLRQRVDLLYHPVGTCRMGAVDDDQAVVDPELRVRGVDGLRVIDASVMPVITGGNTHAPTVMIGERGADLVRGRVLTAA